jgi:hypothetical protein
MKTLKICKNYQIWTFKKDGRIIGFLGIKIPVSAQHIIDEVKC